ncbi:hypothetical protein FQN49_005549 [Arthroderma sp. PD_2]|nr:hypothetical protein FQN49_005549 [Arthroderma sp. PD_2]
MEDTPVTLILWISAFILVPIMMISFCGIRLPTRTPRENSAEIPLSVLRASAPAPTPQSSETRDGCIIGFLRRMRGSHNEPDGRSVGRDTAAEHSPPTEPARASRVPRLTRQPPPATSHSGPGSTERGSRIYLTDMRRDGTLRFIQQSDLEFNQERTQLPHPQPPAQRPSGSNVISEEEQDRHPRITRFM